MQRSNEQQMYVQAGDHRGDAGYVLPISPLINSIAGRPMQDDEMQGAQILRNEAYNQYAAMTRDEAERSRSCLRADTHRQARFSTACQIDSSQTEGTP